MLLLAMLLLAMLLLDLQSSRVVGGLQIRRERSIVLQWKYKFRRLWDMTKHNLSRGDSLKLTLTGLGATLLAACGRALGITATPSPTLTPSSAI